MLGQETLKTWTCWVKKPENPKNLVSKTLKTKKFRVKKPCKTQTFWVRFLVYSGFCTLCGSYQNWLRPSKPQTILGQETLKSLQISVGFQVLFGFFLHTLPGRWLGSQPPWGYHNGLHGVVVVAVADDRGAVAPLVVVVDHGHDDVVNDHHLVPGYKQGPDL